MSKLRKEIEYVINCNSEENGSNTPDFILAEYLTDCLSAHDKAVTAREKWYGREPIPVDAPTTLKTEPMETSIHTAPPVDLDRLVRLLSWRLVTDVPNYAQEGEWLYEAEYEGVRVACGYNDGGPVAWVGHATKDQWIDSVACDGSFESGARRAIELAIELSQRPDARVGLGLTNR